MQVFASDLEDQRDRQKQNHISIFIAQHYLRVTIALMELAVNLALSLQLAQSAWRCQLMAMYFWDNYNLASN